MNEPTSKKTCHWQVSTGHLYSSAVRLTVALWVLRISYTISMKYCIDLRIHDTFKKGFFLCLMKFPVCQLFSCPVMGHHWEKSYSMTLSQEAPRSF